MFNVKLTPYGTILYNPVINKVGIFRQQRVKNPVQPEKTYRVHYMWISVINLIEDDTWAEIHMWRDDQTPITDFTDWVYPDVNTIPSDDPVAGYIYELSKYFAVTDMLENPEHWYINMVDDDVDEFYLEKPKDIWDNIKKIMGVA